MFGTKKNKTISTEWSLSQSTANAIFHMTKFPYTGLFATRHHHRLPIYVSPIADGKALAIDALSIVWKRIHAYAFPFHIIQALPQKIHKSQCKVVHIAPLWPNRSWFPELLNLYISPTITLPVLPNFWSNYKEHFCIKIPTTSRIGIIKQPIRKKVADHVSEARRASTRKVYDTKWKVFTSWANQRKIDPIKASPNVITDFLMHLFGDKHCHCTSKVTYL